MAKVTLVILEVVDDNENREWWDALGLPEPWRWTDSAPWKESAFLKEILVRKIDSRKVEP